MRVYIRVCIYIYRYMYFLDECIYIYIEYITYTTYRHHEIKPMRFAVFQIGTMKLVAPLRQEEVPTAAGARNTLNSQGLATMFG